MSSLFSAAQSTDDVADVVCVCVCVCVWRQNGRWRRLRATSRQWRSGGANWAAVESELVVADTSPQQPLRRSTNVDPSPIQLELVKWSCSGGQ